MEKPPFEISPKVLNLSTKIHETLGELKDFMIPKPSLKLRRENKIKTIHHSLAIEGNTLTEEQITALVNNKRVIGPQKQIIEVQNALQVYDRLGSLNPLKEADLLKAHKLLTKGLVSQAGVYRTTQVGVFKGSKVSHVAPPAKNIPRLMMNLFSFLKDKTTPWLIKACVFHYELEFIHPFEDGNGRMGRLWQQLLLMKQSPIFEFVSVESLIHKEQKAYYSALEKSDKAGDATSFIEFSLELIYKALCDFKETYRPPKSSSQDRVLYALEKFKENAFTRKEYMTLHPSISTSTASRDLAAAVKKKMITLSGDKAKAKYRKAL